ncbi:MAG: Ig-like domain-containing protein [Lachnospiraceae bacterium]|nr:Ig-like domain-containing protein [Lachnospiraceae bacterium]
MSNGKMKRLFALALAASLVATNMPATAMKAYAQDAPTITFEQMTDGVLTKGYDSWTGHPSESADFGSFTFSESGGTVTVEGTANYVSGFEGFNTSKVEEQSGYYVVWQFAVPNDYKDSAVYYLESGDGTIDLEGHTDKKYKKATESNLDNPDGDDSDVCYMSCIYHVNENTKRELVIDWDGESASDIDMQTYTFDYSNVKLGSVNIEKSVNAVYNVAAASLTKKPGSVEAFGDYAIASEDGETFKVTGTANYVSDFVSFNEAVEEQQSGYYIAWQFAVPGNADSVVIKWQSKTDSTETVDDITYKSADQSVLDVVNGVNYFTCISRVTPDNDKKTISVLVDWDGEKTAQDAQKYTIDYSALKFQSGLAWIEGTQNVWKSVEAAKNTETGIEKILENAFTSYVKDKKPTFIWYRGSEVKEENKISGVSDITEAGTYTFVAAYEGYDGAVTKTITIEGAGTEEPTPETVAPITVMSDDVLDLYNSWTGVPEQVNAFGTFFITQPPMENNKVSLTMTGLAQYVAGFEDFNSANVEEQSGYYLPWQFVVPEEYKDTATYKLKSKYGTEGGYKVFDKDALDIVDGKAYFSCIFRLNPDAKDKKIELIIDWDGNGEKAEQTYTIDYSGLKFNSEIKKNTNTSSEWASLEAAKDAKTGIAAVINESAFTTTVSGAAITITWYKGAISDSNKEIVPDISKITEAGTYTYVVTYQNRSYCGEYTDEVTVKGTTSGGSSTGGSGTTGGSTGESGTTGDSGSIGGTAGDNTTTETKPDGSTVETSTETKADGTTVETTTETKPDGTKTETIVETAKDGSVKTTETVTQADGSATKTQKENETNAKGKVVAVTTTTKTDATGAVTSITEKSVIVASSATTSTTVTVKKDGKGEITSASASIAKTVSSGNKATVSSAIVSQIIEAAGTEDVKVTMTVKDSKGNTKYKVKVDAEDLQAGEALYIYKLNTKTGEYTMVNAKTYEVSESGNVSVSVSKKATYELVTEEEAEQIEKQIKSTIKPKKSSASMKSGKSTNFTLSSKANEVNIKSVTYTTSNKSVVTVNKDGKITAKGKGTVTVKAKVTLKNGSTKTIKMTIKVK